MRTAVFLLVLVAFVLLCQMVSCMSESEKAALSGQGTSSDTVLLKRSLRQAYEDQLAMLQEAEENLTQQIAALQHQRQEITQRKRSHYMCLVNLITCYRKRK
ncbi:uncharacterized protein LOC124265877 [Haliotis rubra]|uniref:uncharacterized protein LOC124265877 n=1 Tax=Haliotis rubra TaxID=36100 RepID=UPI001EE62168|nr:uncharacterized protein LOC124265877 [Haliotis rubra]